MESYRLLAIGVTETFWREETRAFRHGTQIPLYRDNGLHVTLFSLDSSSLSASRLPLPLPNRLASRHLSPSSQRHRCYVTKTATHLHSHAHLTSTTKSTSWSCVFLPNSPWRGFLTTSQRHGPTVFSYTSLSYEYLKWCWVQPSSPSQSSTPATSNQCRVPSLITSNSP